MTEEQQKEPFGRGHPAIYGLYLATYLALDWVSYIHELPPLNITPWNPASGLSVAMLLAFGPRTIPLAALALMAADALVRGQPVAFWATALSDLGIALGYGFATHFLRTRLGVETRLRRLRDVAWLLGGMAVTASMVAVGYVAFFMTLGLFPWADLTRIAFRYWVGEVIGISVVAPLLLVHLGGVAWRPIPRLVAETLLQGMGIVVTLFLVFGLPAGAEGRLFYLLFLPAIWMAVRHGLEGATLAVAATQAGLIVGLVIEKFTISEVISFQLLMLALTVTILFLGAVVSERRRMEVRLHEQQSAIAHAARLTEAGEMASGLAHELNQPLTAAISYARAGRKLAVTEGASEALVGLLDKTVGQAERADRVIRGLRGFLRKGDSRRISATVGDLAGEALALVAAEAGQKGVVLKAVTPSDLPKVRVDQVQVQQVLLNLVRNAIQAIADAGGRRREVIVTARAASPGFIEVSVEDSGPGIPEDMRQRLFQPFATTKPDGMGLGLSIGRSIVEAHGGRLWADPERTGGAVFHFTLPTILEVDDDVEAL
ncbi:MAG: ATP-binding protein [Magnetospirillum sp. WYHS-4]